MASWRKFEAYPVIVGRKDDFGVEVKPDSIICVYRRLDGTLSHRVWDRIMEIHDWNEMFERKR